MQTSFKPSRHLVLKSIASFGVFVVVVAVVCSLPLHFGKLGPGRAFAAQNGSRILLPISIDYPEDGSIFPPGITPPTFLWRDAAGTLWSIDIAFRRQVCAYSCYLPRASACTLVRSIRIAVSDSNSPPKLTRNRQRRGHGLPMRQPGPRSRRTLYPHPATVTITGLRDGQVAYSQSHIAFTTSKDAVNAPIFYRDVPLMPARVWMGRFRRWRQLQFHAHPLASPRYYASPKVTPF